MALLGLWHRNSAFRFDRLACFPIPTWHRQGTARSVGDERSGATRSSASMASTGPSPSERPRDGDGEVVQRQQRLGFIVRDSGGKDVFLRASVLERAGITHLHESQRVFVGIAEGRRGPEAAPIQLA
jgi:CspA family cold shock protein